MVVNYSLRDLWGLSVLIDNGRPSSILQLLVSTRAFKATDSRDKIFALIGLASDLDSEFIDYHLSITDIHIRLAKRLHEKPRMSRHNASVLR